MPPSASHSFDEPAPSNFAMPDVILHPPEDDAEHDGPRLVFDAAAASSATTIESRLGLWQQTISSAAPIFFSSPSASSAPNSTSASQHRRRSMHRPRPAAQWDYAPEEADPFAVANINEGQKRERAGEEMDESVEVMKVPRGRTMADITQGLGRAPGAKKGGLKARATMALRNIRSRNGGARKAPVKENATPVAAAGEPPAQQLGAATADLGPSLHRSKSAKRLSKPISQFFNFNSAAPAPPAIPTPEEPAVVSPPDEASTSAHDSTTFSATLHPSLDEPRSPVASPSTKAARRRLSFVKLQSIFAQQPSSLPNPIVPTSPPSRPTSPAYTNDTAPSPDMDDDVPSTPVDDEDLGLQYTVHPVVRRGQWGAGAAEGVVRRGRGDGGCQF